MEIDETRDHGVCNVGLIKYLGKQDCFDNYDITKETGQTFCTPSLEDKYWSIANEEVAWTLDFRDKVYYVVGR